jgi:universal stress protein A
MFQEIPVTEDHIYAFKASGKLTDEDYQAFLPKLTTLNHKYGPLSLLIELEDFKGWEAKAAWADMKYGIEHDNDFNRIAIIGETIWQKWMTSLSNVASHTKARFFKRDELSQAWDWLREAEVDEDQAEEEETEKQIADEPVEISVFPYQHILVAVDLSIYSDAALKRATDLARHYDAELSLVHTIEPGRFGYGGIEMVTPLFNYYDEEQKVLENAQSSLKKIAEELDYENVRHKVIWGSAKSSILSYAEAQNIDLIVVGSHGQSGLSRLLGSTANGVMHGARCDVTVVKIPKS